MAPCPGLQPARTLAQPRPRERAADRQRQPARADEPAGQPHADARPVDARGALVHVAGRRHDDDRAAAGQRPRDRAVAAVADDERRRPASRARRRPSRRAGRWAAPARRPGSAGWPTRARAPAGRRGPRARARSRVWPGSCEVDGAISTSGSSPGGGATSGAGGSHMSGPTTCVPAGHARGYSSWGNVATSASASLMPPWTRSSAGRPEPPPRLVELAAAELQAVAQQRVGPAPQRAAGRGARQPRAAGVRRAAGRHARIEMGDDRPDRHPLQLARQCRREREDVRHDDGRRDLAHERDRSRGSRARPPRRASAGARGWGRRGTPARPRRPCPHARRRPASAATSAA